MQGTEARAARGVAPSIITAEGSTYSPSAEFRTGSSETDHPAPLASRSTSVT